LRIAWKKSSRSNPSGNCVELAALDTTGAAVGVRDSKHASGGHLTMSRTDLAGLLDTVKPV